VQINSKASVAVSISKCPFVVFPSRAAVRLLHIVSRKGSKQISKSKLSSELNPAFIREAKEQCSNIHPLFSRNLKIKLVIKK
jgi:hypothetical protein